MKKILLIGGCGYIGSALYECLLKSYAVDTVDLEWFGNYVNKRNIVNDYKTLTASFLRKYSVVILLAGHSSVQMCENARRASFDNNIQKFLGILDKLSDQKFIYASSSSVYGNSKQQRITEEYDRYTPANYYDLTKKTIDYYAHLSGLRYYGLRFGTVNGYSPNLRIDLMINKMHDIAVKTHSISLSNPQIYRPILGMSDLCRAISKIIEKDGEPGIYNLASFNKTVGEIAKEITSLLKNVEVITSSGVPGYNFSISTEKFEKNFNFQFKDSVKTILSSLIKGYSKAKKTVRV